MKFLPLHALAAIVLMASATATTAVRAETYHHCTAFIDTVPTVISTPGSYCLRKDLSSAVSSGNVITINSSNVRIDCNGFRLNGGGAPVPYGAYGISSYGRFNITVRNCSLNGFYAGIFLAGGSGYLVEDNRSDGSRAVGIWVDGELSVVRRNRITDVGIGTTSGDVMGILAQGDGTLIDDNYVSDVTGGPDPGGEAIGIFTNGERSRVRGNYITTLLPGSGSVAGINCNIGYRSSFEDNTILNTGGAGNGIATLDAAISPVCTGNVVRGFATSPLGTCIDGGGNYTD